MIYSGNPKLVGICVIVTILFFIWLYFATDKPMTPRELWDMETNQVYNDR